ncbi:MAG: PD40 domain-containing protein, partial [Acidobacteria bacterium]|nr:PD40 domain-containing protein [Acidobacteriota bacterium]
MRTLGCVLLALIITGCQPAPEEHQVLQAGFGPRPASGTMGLALDGEGPVRVRRLWNGGLVRSPAPNGTFATTTDWNTGDLAIMDFQSQTTRRVTDKGSWSESSDYAETSVVSPDNAQIAYAWNVRSGSIFYELRVIGVDGSNMRVLWGGSPTVGYIEVQDWSDDGRTIVMTLFQGDGTRQIALIDAEDGDVRVLKTLDWRWPEVAAVSPDGRYLAYDLATDEERLARDIFVIAMDGSEEHRIVDNAANDQLLGWLPDGNLLFYSDRAVWQLPVHDGEATGEAMLVRPDVWNLTPVGMAGYSYIYGVDVELPQVHTAEIDLDAGRLLGDPVPVSRRVVRETGSSAWSPDGKFLAYLAPPQGGPPTTIVIRNIETSEERELFIGASSARNLTWEPSGDAVWFFGNGMRGHWGLHRVVLATGETEPVPVTLPSEFVAALDARRIAFSPDGRTVYMLALDRSQGSEAPHTVIAYDLETEATRRLYKTIVNANEAFGEGHVSVSPDGQTIAFMDRTRAAGDDVVLRVAPADGSGEPR